MNVIITNYSDRLWKELDIWIERRKSNVFTVSKNHEKYALEGDDIHIMKDIYTPYGWGVTDDEVWIEVGMYEIIKIREDIFEI